MFKMQFKKTIFILFILVGIGIFIWKIIPTKAEVAIFNPTSCLGGWTNPQNATGQTTVSPDAVGEFTANNSAVLPANTSADIFCGNFVGTIPKEKVPQKIILTLSWDVERQKPKEVIVNDSFEESAGDILDSVDSNVDFTLIKESETQTGDTSQPDSEPVSDTQTEEPSTPTESSDSQQDSPTDSISPDNSSSPPDSSDSGGDSGSSSEGPTSFLDYFFTKKVFADDELPTTPTQDSNINPQAQELGTNPFLEVSYTLDGIHWKTLGRVDQEHLRYSVFEIPVPVHSTWEDMSHIQISIKNISSIDNTPAVYLDGMSLQVTYGEVDPDKFVTASGLYIPEAKTLTPDLAFEVRDNQKIQELVISGTSSLGGIAIFNSDTKIILLTTTVESRSYVIQPEYFGEGNYTFIKTSDPDTCSNKTLETCQSEAQNQTGTFTVRTDKITTTTEPTTIAPIDTQATSSSTTEIQTSTTTLPL
jgi:hypothetical protein